MPCQDLLLYRHGSLESCRCGFEPLWPRLKKCTAIKLLKSEFPHGDLLTSKARLSQKGYPHEQHGAFSGEEETVPLSPREDIPTPIAASCSLYGCEPTMLTQWESLPRLVCKDSAPLHYLLPLWDPAEWLWLASGQLSRLECSAERQRCWLE